MLLTEAVTHKFLEMAVMEVSKIIRKLLAVGHVYI